ncbi:MAG: ribonuclease P protein component [Planctomycetota bacterium]|jgi:ribonuclease P protein component
MAILVRKLPHAIPGCYDEPVMTEPENIRTPPSGPPGEFRFPKALRLQKLTQFDRVFREGKRISDTRMMLVYAPNGLTHSRIGIVAGRKVGRAVERNRVKRVLREAFRLHRERLSAGYDFVVVPRKVKTDWTLAMAVESLIHLGGDIPETERP